MNLSSCRVLRPLAACSLTLLISASSPVESSAAPSQPPTAPFRPGLREFRTIDGSGNNRTNPDWGKEDSAFLRLAPNAYADGFGSPSGGNRPNPRAVSNAICAQSTSVPNRAGFSAYLWQWGQFVDHDMTLSPEMDPIETLDITIPTGDPSFDPAGTGTQTMPFDRSYWEEEGGIRAQFNTVSSYIDGSMVYGSEPERAIALRRMDGTGKLKTSAGDLLPFNTDGLENTPSGAGYFVAGDVRANEQIALTALHTVFVREHNFWADRIVEEGNRTHARPPRPSQFPALASIVGDAPLNEERIYQLARAIVGAEIQAVTYREFLPALLGPRALPPWNGYRANVNAQAESEFAAAAYRFGHSTLSPTLLRLGANGQPIAAGNISLGMAFFNPQEIVSYGIDPLLRGLAVQRPEEIDGKLVDAVRNFLFGPPGAGGMDLATLNLQRGRDWGFPSYNGVRQAIGLRRANRFADITSQPAVQQQLANVYGTPDKVDTWIGGLCEDHVRDASVGETMFTLLKKQFLAMRDGDRFWYQNYLSPDMQRLIEQQRLSEIIRRNTGIRGELPGDVFHTR